MKYISTSIFVLFFSAYIFAQQAVAFDPTFGVNGKVFFTEPKLYNGIQSICVQADNKILICGTTDSSDKIRMFVKRLNPDGSFDNGFGQSSSYIDKIQYSSTGNDMCLTPDGKILITGTSTEVIGGSENFFIIKLLPNGTKDASFGNNGIFVSNLALSFFNKRNGGRKIKVDTNGNIFIGGALSNSGNNPGIAIFKVTSTGHLDTQFGIGGYRNFVFSFQDRFGDIAIQTDGKILLTGGTWTPDYTFTMRFNPNGSIDSSFATNGKFIKAFNTNDQQARSILVTSDKKILVFGYEESSSAGDIFIYRLDSLGALDTTYGNNGYVSYDCGVYDAPSSIVQLSDKSIIINGTKMPGSNWGDVQLVSFDSLGVLNTNFGNNGNFTYDINNSNDFSLCSIIQPDGKLLNAGYSDTAHFVSRLFTNDYTNLKQTIVKKNNIQIFPNPANDHIMINAQSEIKDYDLFDNRGISLKQSVSLENLTLNTSKLIEGTYYLKISFEDSHFETFKIKISK